MYDIVGKQTLYHLLNLIMYDIVGNQTLYHLLNLFKYRCLWDTFFYLTIRHTF